MLALKSYLVSVKPAHRSTMTDHFRFIQKSTDYKQSWIDARAAMRFGHEIVKIGGNGEPERVPPCQYTVYHIAEMAAETHHKPEPTVKQLVEMAAANGVKLSDKLKALISQISGEPDRVSTGEMVGTEDQPIEEVKSA